VLDVRRREFITLLSGAAVAWPLAGKAQQPAMPTVSLVSGRSADASARTGPGRHTAGNAEAMRDP
jgi:putative tryptophan/tyrosine transport system substrate-binding protein